MPGRPVELEDLLRFRLVGDPTIAPDGSRIAFTVRHVDREKNKVRCAIWVVSSHGEEPRQFTAEGHQDVMPRWSPDGRTLAFVSDRADDESQICLIPADGGEARVLTHLEPGGIDELVWSPDCTRLAFTYRATPAERTKKARKQREEIGASTPPRVHTTLFYRLDGFGYFDGAYAQVWTVDVSTGETRQLTDEPLPHSSLCWSPDGARIGFIANRREDPDLHPLLDDIWIVPAEGGDLIRVPAQDGPKNGLAWSPDGSLLAYVGHTDLDDTWGGRNERVLVTPVSGAPEALDLTGASDKAVGYATLGDLHDVGGHALVVWAPDGRALYCPISERGDTRLYRVDFPSGAMTALTPAGMGMGAFTLCDDGSHFGLLLGDATDPHDVYLGMVQSAGLVMRRLSTMNAGLLAEVDLRMPEVLEASSTEGAVVHGWELRPPDFDAGKRYPCVLYVHGGPAAQYGGQSTPFHELQWLAAQGYVVVFCNPRGSKGYGEAWCSCIRGDWGNRDWADVQAFADRAAGLPYVDASRMAIIGGSYGGYMTAWAVGHTDRFACAIADRLVASLPSMSGTCDFPWQHGKEWKGNAWDDPADLWRCSPLAYAGRITTPLLLIHSDGDLRCPVGQAEELFAALRMQQKVVEFVRYPAETSHGMSRTGPPDLRLDRLKRNLAWLDRWLKTEG